MANVKQKFQDFIGEELSKSQQKMVRGGDIDPIAPPPPAVDPGKTGTGGGNSGGGAG